MPLNLPSLCSPQTFIGIIILLYVYLTLENSISLHQKILIHQKKNSIEDTPNVPRQQIYLSPSPPPSPPPPPSLPPPPSPPPPAPAPPPPSIAYLKSPSTGNFYDDFNITWGDDRGKILDDGEALTLSLDRFSGSGFQSKKEYLFAKIDMQIKLVPNNSAGTVTTYYLSSEGAHHDEIDFEFLGNLTGEPYTIHTNVYCQGVGNREQQFYLWFDPTEDFHTYSILWNPKRIVFFVDETPIREFKNMEAIGVPFPKDQPMKIYSSLWNADDWATQGGRVKADWSQAPFVASYRRFKAKACVWLFGSSTCDSRSEYYDDSGKEWLAEELDPKAHAKIRWMQKNHMTYDYCKDVYRFPQGIPKECRATKP